MKQEETMEEDKGDEEKTKGEGGEKKAEAKPEGEKPPVVEVKKENEEVSVDDKKPDESEKSKDADMGRLVMTVAGEQKQLAFRRRDLLCIATMMVGDKVTQLLFLQNVDFHLIICSCIGMRRLLFIL